MKSNLKIVITTILSVFSIMAIAGDKKIEEVVAEKPSAPEALHIMTQDDNKVFMAGDVKITRVMTKCAKNKGWLQALVPFEGVNPVTEIEILNMIGSDDSLLIDMRTQDWFADATIPTAINIPYTEVASRMDELGCKKTDDKWNCDEAKKVYAFCNGPVCPQSPMAMKAMIRDGFPSNKIYYYRGGMLDWAALGFTTVEGDW